MAPNYSFAIINNDGEFNWSYLNAVFVCQISADNCISIVEGFAIRVAVNDFDNAILVGNFAVQGSNSWDGNMEVA